MGTRGLVNNKKPPTVSTTPEELQKIKQKLTERKENGEKNNLVLFAYKNNLKNKIRFKDDKWFFFDLPQGSDETQTFGGDITNVDNLNILAENFRGLFDYISSDWSGISDVIFKTIIKLLTPEGVFALDFVDVENSSFLQTILNKHKTNIKNFRGCLTFTDNSISASEKLLYKVVRGQSLPGKSGGGGVRNDIDILKQLDALDLLEKVTIDNFPIMNNVLNNWKDLKKIEKQNNHQATHEARLKFIKIEEDKKTNEENYEVDKIKELEKLINIPVQMWSEPNFKTTQEYFSIDNIFIMQKVVDHVEPIHMTKEDNEKIGIQPASLFNRPWEAYPSNSEKRRKPKTCYHISDNGTMEGGRKSRKRKIKGKSRKRKIKGKSRKRKIKRKSRKRKIKRKSRKRKSRKRKIKRKNKYK